MELNELLDRDYPLYYAYWIRCIHKPDNMGYIGIRKSKTPHPKDDWYWGSSCNPEFKKDFKLYGPKGFKKTIISWSANKQVIKEREGLFIDMCGTLVPNGYNIHPTGGGNCSDFRPGPLKDYWTKLYGAEIAEEKYRSRGEKISKASKGKPGKSPFTKWEEKYGKEKADILKVEFFKNKIKSKGPYHNFVNRYGEEVAKEKMKEIGKKISESNKKRLADGTFKFTNGFNVSKLNNKKCVIGGVEYESIKKASEKIGISRHKLSRWINKYGGNKVLDLMQAEIDLNLKRKNRKELKAKHIEFGHHISPCVVMGKLYESVASAAKDLGKCRMTVSHWIRDGKNDSYFIKTNV